SEAHALLARMTEEEERTSDRVRWAEVFGRSVQLHVTPLSPAELFRKQMADHPRAWVFASATLAVGQDFTHFKRELGVEEAAARIEALRAQGGNPFVDFQLPQAVLQLKQGAGRLIRDETDRGVLVLCDPRLYTRSYGRIIRASLPPMKQTRVLADVEAFFARIPA